MKNENFYCLRYEEGHGPIKCLRQCPTCEGEFRRDKMRSNKLNRNKEETPTNGINQES